MEIVRDIVNLFRGNKDTQTTEKITHNNPKDIANYEIFFDSVGNDSKPTLQPVSQPKYKTLDAKDILQQRITQLETELQQANDKITALQSQSPTSQKTVNIDSFQHNISADKRQSERDNFGAIVDTPKGQKTVNIDELEHNKRIDKLFGANDFGVIVS